MVISVAVEELNKVIFRVCRMPKTRTELMDTQEIRELRVTQRDVVLAIAALRNEGRLEEISDGPETKYKARLRANFVD
jgi:hypothetical protein